MAGGAAPAPPPSSLPPPIPTQRPAAPESNQHGPAHSPEPCSTTVPWQWSRPLRQLAHLMRPWYHPAFAAAVVTCHDESDSTPCACLDHFHQIGNVSLERYWHSVKRKVSAHARRNGAFGTDSRGRRGQRHLRPGGP